MVRLSASLKKSMLHYESLAADATPAFLRSHFRRTDVAHPCLGLERGGRSTPITSGAQGGAVASTRGMTSPAARGGAGVAGVAVGGPMGAQSPATGAEARDNALFLLEETVKGLGGDTFGELVGLPLLPLADGSLGRFLAAPKGDAREGSAADGGALFVCTVAERRLLAGEGLGGKGGGAGRRLLEDLDGLSSVTRGLLGDKRVHAVTNVAVMEPRDLARMLDAVFPDAWKGLTQVAWAPGARDVSVLVLLRSVGACGGVNEEAFQIYILVIHNYGLRFRLIAVLVLWLPLCEGVANGGFFTQPRLRCNRSPLLRKRRLL